MRVLFVFVVLLFCGCATDRASKSDAKSPALRLAKLVTHQEDLSNSLQAEFNQRVDAEMQYWHAELPKVLQGAQLDAALQELEDYRQRMSEHSGQLSVDDGLQPRIAAFFNANFNEAELKELVQLLGSPAWHKYQLVMQQMALAPDVLGVHSDFTQALEKEREAMAARIFGEQAVNSERAINSEQGRIGESNNQ